MATYNDVLTDTVTTSSALVPAQPVTFSDIIGVVAYVDVTKAVVLELTDTVTTSEVLASLPGIIIQEHLGLSELVIGNQKVQLILADGVTLADALASASVVILADTVTVTSALQQQLALLLADTLGVTEVLAGAAKYGWTFADTVGLAASLAQFVGAEIVDTLDLADAMAAQLLSSQLLTDTIGITEDVAPRLVIQALAQDTLEITPEQVVQAIYDGSLLDGVELSGGMLMPDGTLTTWVMNTRTAAVTEYQDFEFNSFAQIGHRYVGASSEGLYWLDGDDDLGEDIVARMKGGFLQFGGTRLSRLKAAYIATRGAAEFVLKIETGDGATYNYTVDTRHMRSTKVHMGKGQRARYFAYELTSVGDDFDLETLEFVPIVLVRRV